MMDDRRLRPPETGEATLGTLVENGVFETKQNALTFAAALGFYLGKREPIQKAGEGIRWQVFERSQDAAFIYSLGLAEAGVIHILGLEQEDALAEIFEQYASGGLKYIAENFIDRPGDILDNLLLLIADARKAATGPIPGLEGLTAADLGLLGGLA
jgi:dnd system-associated protein 4